MNTKIGLVNETGQQNCFMNCAIQSLACLKSTFKPMVEQSSIKTKSNDDYGISLNLLGVLNSIANKQDALYKFEHDKLERSITAASTLKKSKTK